MYHRFHGHTIPCWPSHRSAVLGPLIAHSALTNPLVLAGSIYDHSHEHKTLCWLNHRRSCTLANTLHCSVGLSNLWTHVLLHEDLVLQSMIIPTNTKSLDDWPANAQCPLRGRPLLFNCCLVARKRGLTPGIRTFCMATYNYLFVNFYMFGSHWGDTNFCGTPLLLFNCCLVA